MLRLALALAVVSSSVTQVDAAPSKSRTTAKKRTKPSTTRTTRAKRGKHVSRGVLSTKRMYDGLPPGFSWPPTASMIEAGKECEAKLDRAGVKWKHAEAAGRIANPVDITDMMLGGIKYTNMWGPKASSKMECQLALALASIGPELYGLGVREVKFGSIYDWSYVRYQRWRMLSRHAIAVAIDIGSFVDETGRDVKVLHSYKKRDNLLIALEQLFTTNSNFHNIITPKTDPVGHANHFHVEAVVDFNAP